MRLSPASHNAQMRTLMKKNTEAVEELLQFLQEKEDSVKIYRERQLKNQKVIIHELRRFNNILQKKMAKRKRK